MISTAHVDTQATAASLYKASHQCGIRNMPMNPSAWHSSGITNSWWMFMGASTTYKKQI